MKRKNYFYNDKQGKEIILGITSEYIDLHAPDGYFYFEGKFDSKIQDLARKVIPNEIGKLVHEQKEIATGMLERIGQENFPFEKVILKADRKEKLFKLMETLKKARWFGNLQIILADIGNNLTYSRTKGNDGSFNSKLELVDNETKTVTADEIQKDIMYLDKNEIFKKINEILN